MTTDPVILAAEAAVSTLAAQLPSPLPGECLLCFVARQLERFGCDTTLRFACRFRDLTAPRAVALERRLAERGGFCDCECFLNAFTVAACWWTPGRTIERDGCVEYLDPQPPQVLPTCGRVRRGSTQPCGVWAPIRRGW